MAIWVQKTHMSYNYEIYLALYLTWNSNKDCEITLHCSDIYFALNLMIVFIFTDNYHLLPHFLLHINLQNLSQIALLGMFWRAWKWNILLSNSVTPIPNMLTIRITEHPHCQKSAYSKRFVTVTVTATVVASDKAQITLNTKISHHWPSKYRV